MIFWDWNPVEPNDARSFSSLFQLPSLQLPPQCFTPTCTHSPSDRSYLPYSGTLKYLGTFQIEDIAPTDLCASLTYETAKQFFREHRPSHDTPHWWDPGTLLTYTIQLSEIRSGCDALKWFVPLVINRAMPAAMCLWGHVTGQAGGDQPFTFSPGCFNVRNTSNTGNAGRTDRCIEYERTIDLGKGKAFSGLEMKTQHVCNYPMDDHDTDSLSLLFDWLEENTVFHWDIKGRPVYQVDGDLAWCLRARKILLQVWLQMGEKHINHVILANEMNFVLCWKDKSGDCLRVSREYSTQSPNPQHRLESLSSLAYFLTCAMVYQQLDNPPGTQEHINTPSTTSSNNQTSVIGSPSVGHYLYRSYAATVGIDYAFLASAAYLWLWNIYLLVYSLFARLRAILASGDAANISLTWSQTATTTTWNMIPTDSFSRHGAGRSVLNLTKLIHNGQYSSTFRGLLDNEPVIAKYTDCSSLTKVKHEYEIYRHLHTLQGTSIPRCVGLYEVEANVGYILLMEDCGDPVDSLTNNHRTTLEQIITDIHSLGIHHGDLELRNVVANNGDIRVIDFELALAGHVCPCSGVCDEIAYAKVL